MSVIPEFSNVLINVDMSLAFSMSDYNFSTDVYPRFTAVVLSNLMAALCPFDYEIKIALGGIRSHRNIARLV